MNIKDSYIHNGTAVLKDIKVENSVLKKILAGKDANDAYLDWVDVATFGSHAFDSTSYLPTAGGTMTGKINVSYNASNILDDTKGLNFGLIAHVGVSDNFGIYSTGQIILRPNQTWGSANSNGLVITSTAITYNGNSLLHAGNYTSYVYSKSTSDGRYVLKAGDTMTGALTVPSLTVTGASTFSQAINGSILGNAATASRLLNARNIAISGAVTGNANFDGSGNIEISTSVNHTHSYAGSSSAGGAATNVVVNSGNNSDSTYPLVWHSGNTLYSTSDIYCNPKTDVIYSKGLQSTGRIKASSSNNAIELIQNADCGIYFTTGGLWIHIAGSGASMFIYNGTWDNAGNANYNKGIIITSSNNIGIGKTNPSYKLDVSSDIKSDGYIRAASGFIKTGSDNDHILLGNGGHKAVSDFVQITGTQTISGNKTFSGSTSLDDATIGNLVVTGGASFALTINGNIKTADKVNHTLTILLNGGTAEGTNKFTFDGSADKSFSITPSSIGAQASGNYKTKQTAVDTVGASTNTLTFINSISQDTNGVITATTGVVRDASTSVAGVVSTEALSFAGTKTFTNDIILQSSSTSPALMFERTGSGLYDYKLFVNGSGHLVILCNQGGSTWSTYATFASDGTVKVGSSNTVWHAGNLTTTAAANGGTTAALVTTGDKYKWNLVYDWLTTTTADTDTTINKWKELETFLTNITESDTLSGLLALYLPLSGGTMTGNITLDTNSLIYNNTTSSTWNLGLNTGIRILNTVGSSSTGAPTDYSVGLHVSGYYGFLLSCNGANNTFTMRSTRNGSDTPRSWVTLIHSDNYTSYVYSKSTSDSRYVYKSGDTMTGALTVSSLIVNGASSFSLAINGSILGNAATASRLLNTRTINGTSFDGSANITIAPSIQAGTSNTNKVTVKVGNLTSSEYTIPYATTSSYSTYLSMIESSTASYCDDAKAESKKMGIYALTGSALQGSPTGDGFLIALNYSNTHVTLISIDLDPTYKLGIRHWKNDNDGWRGWKNILTSNTTYVDSNGYGTIDGTAITKINYAASAGAVAWSNVSSKPGFLSGSVSGGGYKLNGQYVPDITISDDQITDGKAWYGMYGVYNSYILGHIWSMGAYYHISDNGKNPNNLYGLAYFHTNWSNSASHNTAYASKTPLGNYAQGHLVGWFVNGVLKAAIGSYVWSDGGFLKKNSSNNHILLGGGDHKAISDFVLLTGTQTITGNKTFSGTTTLDDATIGNLVVTGGASFALTINGNVKTADKVNHTLTFTGGVTGTFNGSADKSVAIPTKSSWNYDDVYLKLSGGTLSNASFGELLIIERSGSANMAAIGFKNSNGILGYLATNTVNGTFVRYNSSASAYYTIIDESNHYSVGVVTKAAANYSLWSTSWLPDCLTLPTTAGSYLLTLISGNLTATGVFSVGTSDGIIDEISLHLHGPATFRLYARTNGTKLELASSDSTQTSRSVTIKYKRLI